MRLSMRRVVVTGADGFLGAHVSALLAGDAELLALGGRNADGDVSAPATISRVASFGPDVVLHFAAMTNPDACEERPEVARAVNVEATARLARAAGPSCRLFVYASTDLVFGGDNGPYTEEDTPRPLSVYGKTKLEGERSVRLELGERALVVRLALLYGPRRVETSRPSFAETMLRRARSGEASNLFEDQFRNPLYVEDAASSVVRLPELTSVPPTIHLGGAERCSRYEMGRAALEVFGLPLALARPARMEQVESRAPRPKDVCLDTRAARALGLSARDLRSGFASMRRSLSW